MKKLKKVIFIDDSVSTNHLNLALLESMNIAEQVIFYTSGKSALEAIHQDIIANEAPEIIFLDLQMPDMDGFEFLEEHINSEEYRKLEHPPTIVIVSDYLNFENFSKTKYYKSYGVVDHIRKPLDKSDIYELIEDHFDKD